MAAELSAMASVQRTSTLSVAAMVTIGIAGAVMTIIMPGMLAVLSVSRQLTGSEAAWLSSSEMGGITAATVLIAGWISRLDRRRASLATLLLLVGAHLASFFVHDFAPLLGARFLAGLCEGALLGIMSASVSTTAAPDRIFAVFLTGNLTTSMLLLKLLGFLSGSGRSDWLFLALAVVASIPLLLLPWLPARVVPAAAGPVDAATRDKSLSGIIGLAATFILLVGVGMSWPLVGTLGLQHQFTAETIAGILSVTALVGIGAGVFVYLLGQRIGRRVPIVVGTLGIGLSILGILMSANAVQFALATSIFMFFWVGVMPYYMGVIAVLDPGGRLSALFMAMQFAGLTVGPMAAAFILKASLSAPFWSGFACCALATILMTSAEAASRRMSPA